MDSFHNSLFEVSAWASIFHHQLTEQEIYHNFRSKITLHDLQNLIDNSNEYYREDEYIFSKKFPKNINFQKWKNNANKILESSKEVLAILSSCNCITGLAITGSVAAGVAKDDGDLDILIITKKNWVWRARSLAIFLSHRHESGNYLCPNMVIDESSLEMKNSIYVARELMQMIPIKDSGGLTKLFSQNKWVYKELPNSKIKNKLLVFGKIVYPWWWFVMKSPFIGRFIELWESNRRIKELKYRSKSSETFYTKSICRGHENEHMKRIEKKYSSIMGD